MKIQTKYFGEVEIEDDLIINFENGIPGFETLKNYSIIDVKDKNYKCIQSIEDKDICFLAIFPCDYFKEYEINLLDEDINELEIKNQSEALVLTIITAREKNITTNLVAPIIINIKNRRAKQIILTNNKYSVREKIKCLY